MSDQDLEWQSKLSPEQFTVLRQCGTEPPFQNKYWDCHDDGIYRCAGCGTELFDSETKFDSGTGWPSFSEAAVAANVKTKTDLAHGMIRTEVVCTHCDGHLGHVFKDGPGSAGLRYCINSASLDLKERE